MALLNFRTMKTIKLTNDQFAQWLFNKGLEIENYNFDLMYDITKIITEIKNTNLRDLNTGDLITDKPVFRAFWLQLRKSGSYLFDYSDKRNIEPVKLNFSGKEYKINICVNCSYIYNQAFAEITELN